MGRISTRTPKTEFGVWLFDQIERRGWERKTVAIRSGVSNTHVNQIIAGDRSASREVVRRIVTAFAGEADQWMLLNAAYKAAGFASASETENVGSPAAQLVQEKLGETTITDLSAEEMDALISRIEDQAEFEVRRLAKEKAAASK